MCVLVGAAGGVLPNEMIIMLMDRGGRVVRDLFCQFHQYCRSPPTQNGEGMAEASLIHPTTLALDDYTTAVPIGRYADVRHCIAEVNSRMRLPVSILCNVIIIYIPMIERVECL